MAIETNELIDVKTLSPFKKFIMTIGNLPTSYLESMTYAELLMWFCNYLQETVIPTVNNNAEAVEELQDFVSEYFDNLDLTEEVEKKLDEMAEDGTLTNLIKDYVDPIYMNYQTAINAQISMQNSDINNLTTRVDSLASGSPLVASSTSGMTDTDRVYVNTTDGKWYYYDGEAWQIGGTYQSTELADESVTKYKLNDELRDAIYKTFTSAIDISTAPSLNLMKYYSGMIYVGGVTVLTLVVPIEGNTTYNVTKMASTRFSLYLSEEYPAPNVEITGIQENNGATSLSITSGADDKYLGILYYNPNSDTQTAETIRASINVYRGEVVEEETWADYLESQITDFLLTDKYINLVSTKQLGSLQKGYIAISCDDGANELADITIPLFLGYKTTYGKNIPLTMGLMSTSPVITDATRLTTVHNFINSTGSSVAIHGGTPYTSYSDSELYEFLDTQKTALTSALVAPTSIIYPNHDYNTKTSVIAGSYYGVCCTGGINTPIKYGSGSCAGDRSNMYTLYRDSLFNAQMTKQKIKDAIDYAYDHHMIYMPFFHDNNLTSDYDRCKDLLDYCVEYANTKGLEFINVGDIPYIK